MSDTDDDGDQNDSELEVSRLDAGVPGVAAHAQPASRESAPGAQDETDTARSPISLEYGSGARPRRWWLRASVTGLVVTLAVAIVLVSFSGIGERLGAPLHSFSPTPTISLGSDIILLAHTVPWGELQVNGRTEVAIDLGDADGYHAYRLPPGQHTLDYLAALFPTVHCVLSVPKRTSDTCKMLSNRELASHPVGEGLRALDMGATVFTMDSRERSKLQALLENGSSFPPITVEPGMHYPDQNRNIAVARERMTATMAVGAAPPTTEDIINNDGQPCGEFCAPGEQNDPTAWMLFISARQRWMYAANGSAFTASDANSSDITPARVTWINNNWVLLSDSRFGNLCYSHVNSSASMLSRLRQVSCSAQRFRVPPPPMAASSNIPREVQTINHMRRFSID
jgi:hypothetical protein